MAFDNGQLGNLIVEISADLEKLKKGLTQADGEINKFSLKSQVSVKGLTQAFLSFSAVAGTAVVAGLTAAVKSTIEYSDEIYTASKRTGIATETLSRLKFVAEQTESSFEALTQGFKFLNRNIYEASTGNDKLLKSFENLGVQVKDSNGVLIDTEKAFLQVADKISKTAGYAEKAGLAMQVFGRNGTALLPVLDLGSQGIERLSKRAEELGLVLTKDNAEAIDQLDDSLKELKSAVGGASLQIGTALIPILTKLVEKVAKFATPAIQELNAALVNTGEVVTNKQLKEAFKSGDPALDDARIQLVKIAEMKKKIQEGDTSTIFLPPNALQQLNEKEQFLQKLVESRRENFPQFQAENPPPPDQVEQTRQMQIQADEERKAQYAQTQAEIAAMSDADLQREIHIAQQKILLTKTSEEQRSAAIKAELEKRAKLQALDNQILSQSFGLLSTLVQTFAGESKAAAIALKAIRIGEVLINGMKAISEIEAFWSWNPPVMASLVTRQRISTALQIATIAATGFATGTDSVPARLTPGEMVVPNTFSDAIREGRLSLSGPDGNNQNQKGVSIENISITVNGTMDENSVPNIIEELGIQLENRLRGAI